MRGLLRLVVVVAVLAALLTAGAAYAGVVQVPVLSAAFGMDKPLDLGALKADPAGYAAFQKKHGIKHTSPDANYTLSSLHQFSGSYSLDELIPESIILATRTLNGYSKTIHDVTVKFHNGSASAAAFFDASPWGVPLSGPVKVDFKVAVTGPKGVKVTIDNVQFGRIGIPADLLTKAQDAVNGYLATRLAGIDGLQIDKLQFQEGGVYFKGTLPNTFGSDAPKPGQLP
jgi:hypothetical protein